MAKLRMEGVATDAEIPTPASGTATIFYNSTDRVYKVKLDDGSVAPIGSGGGGGGTWGSITGTLSAQTDLQNALDAKYDASNPDSFVDAAGAASAAPVQSVAGQTGIVTLASSDVGLGNVDNTSDANKPISTATQLALNDKYDASNPANFVDAAGASSAAPVQSVAGKTGTVTLSSTDVGLGNVDNTSDANKPVSTATQSALNAKLSLTGGNMTGDINMEEAGSGGGGTTFVSGVPVDNGFSVRYGFVFSPPVNSPLNLYDDSEVLLGTLTYNPTMFMFQYAPAPGSVLPFAGVLFLQPAGAEMTGTGVTGFTVQVDKAWPVTGLKVEASGVVPSTYHKVIGLADATNARDAVNKQQLDTAISSIIVPVTSVAGKTGAVILSSLDVGLGNVNNTSDADKPISSATQLALDDKYDASNPANYVDAAGAAIASPVQSVAGQTGSVVLSKSDVGLDNADNTSDADKPVSTATQLALNDKYDASNPNNYVDSAGAASAAPVQSVAGKTGVVVLDKTDVGLSDVDNTSDLNKPISTATQVALDDLTVATQDNATSLDDLTVYAQDIRTDLDQFVAPSGSTRPASPVVGQIFFDTSLGKPVFYNGSAWVDATGTVA